MFTDNIQINDELEKYILYAETKNTVLFKTIIELISSISSTEQGNKKQVKQLCMKISKDGFEIFTDSQKIISSNIILNTNYFDKYFYSDEDEILCIGISLDIIKSSFKYIHRTDTLCIAIKKDENIMFPNTIFFTLNNSKGFSIKFNVVQNIEQNSHENYVQAIEIPAKRLSNLYREMGGIKKRVFIESKNGQLLMFSTTVDISENWVSFPLIDNKQQQNNISDISIKSEYFKIVSKMSLLDTNVKMYIDNNKNILLVTNVLALKTSDVILGEAYTYISVNK